MIPHEELVGIIDAERKLAVAIAERLEMLAGMNEPAPGGPLLSGCILDARSCLDRPEKPPKPGEQKPPEEKRPKPERPLKRAEEISMADVAQAQRRLADSLLNVCERLHAR